MKTGFWTLKKPGFIGQIFVVFYGFSCCRKNGVLALIVHYVSGKITDVTCDEGGPGEGEEAGPARRPHPRPGHLPRRQAQAEAVPGVRRARQVVMSRMRGLHGNNDQIHVIGNFCQNPYRDTL